MFIEKMLEKAVKDPSCRPEFYDQLLKCDLVVLYIPEEENFGKKGYIDLKKGQQIKIKEFIDKDGEHLIPIFTSVEALQKGIKEEEAFILLNARVLFEMTKGAAYILNPYSSYSKKFTSQEIENLLSRALSPSQIKVIKENTKVLIGQPKDYPHDLVMALKKYFVKVKTVKAAYLALIFNPSDGLSAHLIIGVDMLEINQKILRDVIEISKAFLKQEEYIDVIVVKERENIFKSVTPFYERSTAQKNYNFLEWVKRLFGY